MTVVTTAEAIIAGHGEQLKHVIELSSCADRRSDRAAAV